MSEVGLRDGEALQRIVLGCRTMDRNEYPVRKASLHDQGREQDTEALTPGERLAMVWALTVQAWMFREGRIDEPRLRRDVVRVRRGGS